MKESSSHPDAQASAAAHHSLSPGLYFLALLFGGELGSLCSWSLKSSPLVAEAGLPLEGGAAQQEGAKETRGALRELWRPGGGVAWGRAQQRGWVSAEKGVDSPAVASWAEREPPAALLSAGESLL